MTTTIPDGWKLVPIEPNEAMLDAGCKQHRCEQGDPWYSSPDLGEGDCRDIYAAMLNTAPAAAGVSTVEDAGAQKEAVMDAIADALGEAYDCTRVWHAWSYGTMGPDDFALVAADPSRVAEIATAAIAARRPAPAAGDALALLDHPLLRDVLGYIEDAGPADVWGAAQSWMSLRDAALAAQRKGDA
ncbi:hypothetical protein [Achromobacter xylosoxidans]|uniref:hypothetical protein n=1 Tax=Alcaligenes xylosoxydans xylosoxydans TaxID=85698 RepID=UPI0021C19804|nr:hypothetical protein [Achromobacter xylosoxidans]UXL06441.1 hypothetical protein N4T34_06975 [Achromobacter xylosoxidans]